MSSEKLTGIHHFCNPLEFRDSTYTVDTIREIVKLETAQIDLELRVRNGSANDQKEWKQRRQAANDFRLLCKVDPGYAIENTKFQEIFAPPRVKPEKGREGYAMWFRAF